MARDIPYRLCLALLLAEGSAPAQTADLIGPRGVVTRPCPEVSYSVVLGIESPGPARDRPHVDIMRCPETGALQLFAWERNGKVPAVGVELYRASIGPILANGNVVVVVAPGGYDVVVVVQYRKGKPQVVFKDSTHGEISISSTASRVSVAIGAWRNNSRRAESFDVDETELTP